MTFSFPTATRLFGCFLVLAHISFAQDVYVANLLSGYENGTVSAINTASNSVVATVPVGWFPSSILLSPTGDRLFVVNARSSSVSIMDTASKSIILTVPVCTVPLAAALNPTGTKLYVTCADEVHATGSLSILDANLLTPLGTVSNIGYAAEAIAITPDEKKAFIPLRDSGSVAVVNLETSAVHQIAVGGALGSGPFEICFSPNGTTAYIAIPSDTMAVIDTPSEQVIGRIAVSARAVTSTPDGQKLYVANSTTSTVSVISLTDGSIRQIDTGAADGYANHLALHTNGRIYVTKAKWIPSPGALLAIETTNDTIVSTVQVGLNPFKVATLRPRRGDSAPPTTTADVSPRQNGSGWNAASVIANLRSVDNDAGSGVNEIHFALSGSQTAGWQTVAGTAASVPILNEGSTILSYYGVDRAGNQEVPRSLTVKIDKTAPTVSGMPAAGCTLSPPNGKLVQVATVFAADVLSGVVPGSFKVTGTSSEATDANNPAIVITPNGNGGFDVQLRAERTGNGNDRIYTLTATANDAAGNTVTKRATCTVPHDQGK